MANNSLFQALGGSPQAPAAPGSPGVAAVPQDQNTEELPSLYQGLQQQPVDDHLQLGPMIAANGNIDQGLAQSLKNAFGGGQSPSSNGHSQPQQASPAPVNPYQNFANKATGKNYR